MPHDSFSCQETLTAYTLCCTTDQCNRCGLLETLPLNQQYLVPCPPGCPPIPPPSMVPAATPTETIGLLQLLTPPPALLPIVIAALVVVTILTSALAATIIGAGLLVRRRKVVVVEDLLKGVEASSGHGEAKMEQKTIVDEIRRIKHIGNRSHTELWMIVEYHENGSLYDYISNHTLTTPQVHIFLSSIVGGLAHLHSEIRADNEVKPGIAHRDLKSKNILVKRDMTCCLADFGLAIRQDLLKQSCVEKVPPHPQQRTKRYMAPEIQDSSISAHSFSTYQQADMYALSLVMWELLRRCQVGGKAPEYAVPYQGHVPHDPSVEEMRDIVVLREIRPELEERWNRNEVLAVVSSLMQECWRSNPHARLTVGRVRKSLQMAQIQDNNKDSWI
ncbi:hypothetical protein EMCRGX_G007733 [Ephydatia muelleri]